MGIGSAPITGTIHIVAPIFLGLTSHLNSRRVFMKKWTLAHKLDTWAQVHSLEQNGDLSTKKGSCPYSTLWSDSYTCHSYTCHVVCHKETQRLHVIWKLAWDASRIREGALDEERKASTLLSHYYLPHPSILYYSIQPYEVGIIFVPILKLKKLRNREVK